MSPEAISARLRQVSELRDLCLFLGEVGAEHFKKTARANSGEESAGSSASDVAATDPTGEGRDPQD